MKEDKRPFFVRFLENQELSKLKTDVRAGGPKNTRKYPSDDDEFFIS